MVEVKAPSFGHKRYFIEQRGEFVESELNSQLAQFSFIVVQLYFVRESKSQDADLHKNLEGNEHKTRQIFARTQRRPLFRDKRTETETWSWNSENTK